jgi:hypothetical protein
LSALFFFSFSAEDLTIAICPGICNSSDTIYIQAFIHNALRRGFRCAVLNHIGTLPSVPLKTARIFSYGERNTSFPLHDFKLDSSSCHAAV